LWRTGHSFPLLCSRLQMRLSFPVRRAWSFFGDRLFFPQFFHTNPACFRTAPNLRLVSGCGSSLFQRIPPFRIHPPKQSPQPRELFLFSVHIQPPPCSGRDPTTCRSAQRRILLISLLESPCRLGSFGPVTCFLSLRAKGTEVCGTDPVRVHLFPSKIGCSGVFFMRLILFPSLSLNRTPSLFTQSGFSRACGLVVAPSFLVSTGDRQAKILPPSLKAGRTLHL